MVPGLRAISCLGTGRPALRNAYAPDQSDLLAVCPHCWEVNVRAFRLCGRCGADMQLALQESGGLRATAPVQSPVPMRGGRLSVLQRALVICFVMLLFVAHVLSAVYASSRRAANPSPNSSNATTPPAQGSDPSGF